MNDTVRFTEGALGARLEQISQTNKTKENLIFANGLVNSEKGVFIVNNKNGLVDTVSYLITWIANFGMWTDDFRVLPNKDRMVDTLMQHVDWVLCMADNDKQTRIVVDRFLVIAPTKNKGRYNIFETFITKYLSILSFHKLSWSTVVKEKYRLYRYFVLNWYFLLKKDKEYTLDASSTCII